MLRYLYGDQLKKLPTLRDSMFRHRAIQFHDRLGWDVTVDDRGHERDQYDPLNPLYVIWQRTDGTHGGSMRFLPTVGRTMVNEHFTHLTEGVKIVSPLIWECTRFCLAPDATARTAAALALGGSELGRTFDLSHAVAVFDAPRMRLYKAMGGNPTVLGSDGAGRNATSVALWDFTAKAHNTLLSKSGIPDILSRQWLEADLFADSAASERIARIA